MTLLEPPVTAQRGSRDSVALVAELRRRLRVSGSEVVDDSVRVRAEYSTDASNYRVVPTVVVVARHVDDVLAVAEVSRETGTPLTVRGGGTSVAGNAVGTGIVVDVSRHLTRILAVDPDARTATVEPGVVLTSLQGAVRPHGLRFGPDPSTQARCTLGGMIGNNACGPHAVAYGRTADNVVCLDMVDGTGRRFAASRLDEPATDPVPGVRELVDSHLGLIRTELGRFGRQVSGYSLEHLLPEHGRDLAKALVGTEGTCGLVLGATVRLVDLAPATALAVLGYPDMATAADAVPALLPHAPLAVEGIDARLVDVVRRHKGEASVPALPPGGGWLFCEVGGADEAEAFAAARRLAADSGTTSVRVVPPGPDATALWRIREDGAGLAGRTADGRPGLARLGGRRGAARAARRLPAGLRGPDEGARRRRARLRALRRRLRPRPDRPPAGRGAAPAPAVPAGGRRPGRRPRRVAVRRARRRPGPQRAAGPDVLHRGARRSSAASSTCSTPTTCSTPAWSCGRAPLDADLRRPTARPTPSSPGGFPLLHDSGDLTRAVHRCVGVGKCRADTTAAGGFMCPSYLATRQEKDSTRGRARVLQELTNGTLVGGVDHPAVHESLDLCLSCKACASDCPAGVDMATYKSEVLHRRYRGRVRPVTHYSLGWLPRWSALVGAVPGLAAVLNVVLALAPVRRLVLRLGGMDARRSVPRFATRTLRQTWAAGDGRSRAGHTAVRDRVVLWADSFTDGFSPDVGTAARRVLEDAGYDVVLAGPGACCGLTWISTGQLDAARARLRGTLDVLSPYVDAGLPVVGLEPSCTAALRGDLPELLADDERAARVSGSVRTLAELLVDRRRDGWTPPDLTGLDVLAQPHCHQHAEMGYRADLDLLTGAGATVRALAGCCGLAGNFGMEAGHYEVSVAVAEHALLPALRDARPGTVLLADGFSCRTQADDLAGVRGRHLAEVLASRLT